jgi:hypothetical protein
VDGQMLKMLLPSCFRFHLVNVSQALPPVK